MSKRSVSKRSVSESAVKARRRIAAEILDSNARRKTGSAVPDKSADAAGTGGAFQPTSLKLPRALKAQIDAIARTQGVSPHAYMVNTLGTAAARAQLRAQLSQDAQDAGRQMTEAGRGYELGEVREYFAKLAAFRSGQSGKPKKPRLTKVV